MTVQRCGWCSGDPLYIAYHDQEWGQALLDENRLFEMLCLEGQQAGLAWITVLRKREAFRKYVCATATLSDAAENEDRAGQAFIYCGLA
jgi:DNA-3-methyladenine glycosylase I